MQYTGITYTVDRPVPTGACDRSEPITVPLFDEGFSSTSKLTQALVYVTRTRVGFAPASRASLMAMLRRLEVRECPFANLPEARSGRWGERLTAEKMKECVWVRPELVGEVEFVEWTPEGHLRHARFVGMKEEGGAGTGAG
jgi:ATP-dependent DNA ligase